MSITEGRRAIAAALSTVPGVKGFEYRPTVPKPGNAWPTLPAFELHSGLLWQAEWTVIVFLPQDERAASEWIDGHFEDIAQALRGPGFPTAAEPGVMKTEGGDQYVLEITLRSE